MSTRSGTGARDTTESASVLSAALAPIPNKALLRIDEVSEILGISINQVRNFILDGTLRGKLVNSQLDAERKHVRVLTSSVVEFLADEKRDA